MSRFRKKLDERTCGLISIELSMFMRWVEENRNRMLSSDEAEDIATRILKRENFAFDKEDLILITGMAFASEIKKIDKLRNTINFDSSIDAFCHSIGISAS